MPINYDNSYRVIDELLTIYQHSSIARYLGPKSDSSNIKDCAERVMSSLSTPEAIQCASNLANSKVPREYLKTLEDMLLYSGVLYVR